MRLVVVLLWCVVVWVDGLTAVLCTGAGGGWGGCWLRLWDWIVVGDGCHQDSGAAVEALSMFGRSWMYIWSRMHSSDLQGLCWKTAGIGLTPRRQSSEARHGQQERRISIKSIFPLMICRGTAVWVRLDVARS